MTRNERWAALLLATAALGSRPRALEPDAAVTTTVLREPRVIASARADATERTVTVTYSLDVARSPGVVRASLVRALAFAPRALCWLDANSLCVVGIEFAGRAGATVIEVWELTPPRPGRGTDGREAIEPGERRGVRTVFRADLPGLHDARAMAPRLGTGAPAVLVWFRGPRNPTDRDATGPDQGGLWSIETEGLGRMRLQAGAAGSGAPVIARDWPGEWVGMRADRHVGGEIAYSPLSGRCVEDPDEPIALLWDRDEDGLIDASESLSPAEWERRRYSHPESWR